MDTPPYKCHHGSSNTSSLLVKSERDPSNQGLIDPRSGERACNSACAYRDDEVLVVTKNRTLQSLPNPPQKWAKLYNSPKNSRAPTVTDCSAQLPLPPAHTFGSSHQDFAVSTGICGVACPLPTLQVDKPLL